MKYCYFRSSDPLNSELAKVAEWFDSNKLTLNVNKTRMLRGPYW